MRLASGQREPRIVDLDSSDITSATLAADSTFHAITNQAIDPRRQCGVTL